MSDKEDKKKAKKAKKSEEGQVVDEHVRLSTHPGAVASVKRMRARCGLGGFFVIFALCVLGGVPTDIAVERALLSGVVCHLVGWWAAIAVWRSVIRVQAAQAAEAYNARIRKAHQDAAANAAAVLNAAAAAEAEAQAQWSANISS
jgi:hypothetical protein